MDSKSTFRSSVLLYVCISLYIMALDASQSDYFQLYPPDGPNKKSSVFMRGDNTCVGKIDIRNEPKNLKWLKSCGVIEGSLSFVLIDNALPSDYELMTFPNLTEITDYFLMYRVTNLTSMSEMFPNLAIIGGHRLFFNYALVIYEMHALEIIGFRSLTTITRGAIRIEKNPKLCYIDTISWESIMDVNEMENNIISDNKQQRECVNSCQNGDGRSCKIMFKSGSLREVCWTGEHCQRICSLDCPHSCSLKDPSVCCDEQCLGGCNGRTANDCLSCINFIDNRTCVSHCPSHKVEILGRYCILPEECPPSYQLFQGVCSAECPTGYTNDTNEPRSCAPCSGACPKVCRETTIQSVTDMEVMQGCTIIDGSLTIQLQGGSYTANKLETYLGLIEEIRGALVIIRAFSLVSLSFLKNLKVIRGNILENYKYSVYVLDNRNLQDLFSAARNNITIQEGKIFFHYNPKLCHHKIESLARMAGTELPLDTNDVSTLTNGDFVACSSLKMQLTYTVLSKVVYIQWFVTDEMVQAIGDIRKILGFAVSWRIAPTQNVSEFEGEETCGTSLWDSDYTEPEMRRIFLTNLRPWTQYAIYVRSYTISGTNEGVKTDITYFNTSEDEPSPPTNIVIHSISSSHLRVMWEPPDEPNGNVTRYRLRWIRQAPPVYDQLDFCFGKLPSSHRSEVPTVSADKGGPSTDRPADGGQCDCEDEGGLKDDAAARNQISFENALHNLVFVRR